MLVFDEKKYAEKIIKNKKYETVKTQGRERCILVRYLTHIGKSYEEIMDTLFKLPMSGGEYLTRQEKRSIYDRIIKKANKYDFIQNPQVCISQRELDVIESLDDVNLRHLLFVYLVYYKWAKEISYLQFYSKKNETIMVIENNNDIWKLAGLSKLRVADRYLLCNALFIKGLYKIDNFKSHNYIYIPFVEDVLPEDAAMVLTNFDNIIGELDIYEEPNNFKRCAICNKVIRRTRSPKKYCVECARLENIRKTKENKKRLKS